MLNVIPTMPDSALGGALRLVGRANALKIWEAVMLDQYAKGATHAALALLILFTAAFVAGSGRKRDS